MSPHPPQDFWRHYREIVSFLITIAGAVASMGDWSSQELRLLFRAVAVIAAAYLVYRFLYGHMISRFADAGGRKARRYIEAIERVSERLMPLFEERFLLIVVIGRDDSEDSVTHEYDTNPTPQLALRLIRPIIPFHQKKKRVRLREIDFRWQVDDGPNGAVNIFPLGLDRAVWLEFEPAVTKPTIWRVSYRPKGLWRELRETNRDRLVWNGNMPHFNRSPLTDFRVRFVFLDPSFRPNITVDGGLGQMGAPRRGDDGEWIIEWRDPHPRDHNYTWRLTRVSTAG